MAVGGLRLHWGCDPGASPLVLPAPPQRDAASCCSCSFSLWLSCCHSVTSLWLWRPDDRKNTQMCCIIYIFPKVQTYLFEWSTSQGVLLGFLACLTQNQHFEDCSSINIQFSFSQVNNWGFLMYFGGFMDQSVWILIFKLVILVAL